MYQVTSDRAQSNFNEILDRASQDAEGVAIVQANKSFVLISQEELEALIETIALLKDPTLLDDVQQVRQAYSRGEVLTANQVYRCLNQSMAQLKLSRVIGQPQNAAS